MSRTSWGLKDIKLGLASYGVVYGLVDFGFQIPANALLFAVLLGVVARCDRGLGLATP